MHSVSIMGYEKLRVAKPLKQLIKILELHTRHIAREKREQWRDARMLLFSCLGSLIRASEEWDNEQKGVYLKRFLDDFAVFRGMMQVLMETKVVSVKKASEIGLLTAQIRPQIAGWRNTIERDSTSLRPGGESIM